MMRQDRFFTAILASVVILAALALALFFIRRDGAGYSAENTPSAVLQNYAIALSRGDYERAYSDISPRPLALELGNRYSPPDLARFKQFFLSSGRGQLANSGIEIGEAVISGEDAYVSVSILHSGSGLFNAPFREYQTARLMRVDGSWKIVQGPFPYWNFDWSVPYSDKTVPAEPVPSAITPPAATATPKP